MHSSAIFILFMLVGSTFGLYIVDEEWRFGALGHSEEVEEEPNPKCQQSGLRLGDEVINLGAMQTVVKWFEMGKSEAEIKKKYPWYCRKCYDRIKEHIAVACAEKPEFFKTIYTFIRRVNPIINLLDMISHDQIASFQ